MSKKYTREELKALCDESVISFKKVDWTPKI